MEQENKQNQRVVLRVENLTKVYGKRTVVDHISFEGYAGEVLGILGPNGAGKTTTIRMITGLAKAQEGSVSIDGHDIREEFEAAMQAVGAIVETPHLYQNMTGADNLKLFAGLKRVPAERVEEIRELIGLQDHLSEKVKKYSLGMRQRLGIGVAMLSKPGLLILDEPTNGLDPFGVKDTREFVQKLARETKTCVMLSSHMLLEMQHTCDRFLIMNEGKLLCSLTQDELQQEGIDLEEMFTRVVAQGHE